MLHNHRTNALCPPEWELLETEETYVKHLLVLVNTFVLPMEKWLLRVNDRFSVKNHRIESNLFPMDDLLSKDVDIVKMLFSNIKQIQKFNQIFLQDLIDTAIPSSTLTIADIFEKKAQFLKLYNQYIVNFENSNILLKKLCNDQR